MSSHRKLDSMSPHYLDCFTVEELADYIAGAVEPSQRKKIFHHLNLEKCAHCRNLYTEAEDIVDQREARKDKTKNLDRSENRENVVEQRRQKRIEWLMQNRRKHISLQPAPSSLANGQIWTTRQQVFDGKGEVIDNVRYAYPVVVVDSGKNCSLNHDNIIRVAPISVDTDFLHPGHSIALECKHLKFSAIIEVFNEKPMLAGNLKEFRSALTQKELTLYKKIRASFIAGTAIDPDPEIMDWERKELQLTEYLTSPVNETVWDGDEVMDFSYEDEILPDLTDLDMQPKTRAERTQPENIVKFPNPTEPAYPLAETAPDYPEQYETTQDIDLVQYKLAAADPGPFHPERSPHILYSSPALKIAIIQRWNSVICQILIDSEQAKSETLALSINKEAQTLTEKYPGVFEVKLGEAGQMPEKLDLKCHFGEWELSFTPRFNSTPAD